MGKIKTQAQFQQFLAEMKDVGKPNQMTYEMWVSNGYLTSDEYCRIVYECSFDQLKRKIESRKQEDAEKNPYKKTTKGDVSLTIKRRIVTTDTRRFQLLRVGDNLTSGLEIPFIKLWASLPDKTTSVREMSQIFVNAVADKRRATAQNMIRRALARGDAKPLD